MNRIPAKIPRTAGVFAVVCVLALLTACGAENDISTDSGEVVSLSLMPRGATSPEELTFLSDVVARVRLLSASAGVRAYPSRYSKHPTPVLVFRFRVIEYLKGSGDAERTVRVLAKNHRGDDQITIHPSPSPAPDANAVLRTAQTKLAERDARWDDRDAIVFLRSSPISEESGDYEFTWRNETASPRLSDYAITSDYDNANAPNRAWLPGVAVAGDAATEPRYFTSAPDDQLGGAVASSAPSSATTSATSPTAAVTPSTPSISPCRRSKRSSPPMRI